MKTVFENQYVTMYIDEEHQLLNDVWTEQTTNMKEEELKELMIEWRSLVIAQDIQFALIDTRKMLFVVDPDLQDWIATELNAPAHQNSLLKAATLLPATIFEQVSLQQTMDEMKDINAFELRAFDNEVDAKNWLLING